MGIGGPTGPSSKTGRGAFTVDDASTIRSSSTRGSTNRWCHCRSVNTTHTYTKLAGCDCFQVFLFQELNSLWLLQFCNCLGISSERGGEEEKKGQPASGVHLADVLLCPPMEMLSPAPAKCSSLPSYARPRKGAKEIQNVEILKKFPSVPPVLT